MDEKLKQRLVGAAVLVSLAVIFVPMILDERDRDMGEPGSNLPPAPDFEVRDHIRPIELPPPLPEDEAPADTENAVAESGQGIEVQPTPEPRPEAVAAPAAEAPESAGTEAPPAATTPAASPPSSGAAPQRGSERAAPPGSVPGWVVQVGSFGSERNARALAARLTEAGFSAFVSRTEKGGRAFYRVRVGPVAERKAAEALKARLDAHLGQKTLVLRAEEGASR